MTIREIEWTVAGAPVGMSDWQANMVAPGGFDRFTGSAQASKVDADPGAPVVGYRPNGTVLYYGEVVSNPRVQEGIAQISAQGPKARLEKFQSRFPYQSRDYSQWAPGDSDPYSYPGLSDQMSFETSYGQLKWAIDQGMALAIGEFHRVVRWTPNSPVYRIAFTLRWTGSVAAGVWELAIQTARGPSGGVNAVAVVAMSGSTAVDVDQTIAGTDDLIALTLRRLTAATTTLRRTFRIVDLRVNNWSNGDFMTPSEVATDVGARLGLDTVGVQASTPNCLPLDFFGTAADLLTYIDQFDSYRWLVLEKGTAGYKLDRGAWTDDEWRAARSRGAAPDLEMTELFNKVTVPYTTTAGAPATVSLTANPDPLSSEGIVNEYIAEPLPDQQSGEVLANTAASEILDRVSVRQARGTVQIAKLWGEDGEHDGWDLTAGGTLEVVDHDPAFPAQRVVGVTYTPGGIISAALTEDTSAGAILAKIAARRERNSARWVTGGFS